MVSFRAYMRSLERVAGSPGHDISLATQIGKLTKEKIAELGLDPEDTTGAELYHSLRVRLLDDERNTRLALGVTDNSDGSVIQAVKGYANTAAKDQQAFVFKQPAIRKLLKNLKPKATMKALGYRSMDSMFRHESPAEILAASYISESAKWHKARLDAYKKVDATDFELRPVQYYAPSGKRWDKLCEKFITKHHHTITTFYELGSVVVMPIKGDLPALALMNLALCLHAVNDIRSVSAYLKLRQVCPDFGETIARAVHDELTFEGILKDTILPWKTIHWCYGNGRSGYDQEVFEPHVQAVDLAWLDVETAMARLYPGLKFWRGTGLLALLDGHEAVSLNLLDVTLNACNRMEYAERFLHAMQQAVVHELRALYLRENAVHAKLIEQLQRQLAPDLS